MRSPIYTKGTATSSAASPTVASADVMEASLPIHLLLSLARLPCTQSELLENLQRWKDKSFPYYDELDEIYNGNILSSYVFG
jgi:hypothetical protein